MEVISGIYKPHESVKPCLSVLLRFRYRNLWEYPIPLFILWVCWFLRVEEQGQFLLYRWNRLV